MLETTRKILEEAGDARVELIVESVMEDERRYHALFKSLHEGAARREAVTDQEFWGVSGGTLYSTERLGVRECRWWWLNL